MAELANSGIYEIVNLVNGKRYIGSSINVHRRERQHFWSLAKGTHHNARLQNGWWKYGRENFRFAVIELCERSEIVIAEQAAFDRLLPEYNLSPTAGNILGFKFPLDACLKLRGRKRSLESVEKTAAAHRGMKRSDLTRERLSQAATGSRKSPRSDEHRAKLSAALKGKPKSPEHMTKFQEGRARRVFTPDQRASISQGLRAAYSEGRKRRDRPEEYRSKIAATLTGRKLTPEHRANVSAAMVGKKRGPYNLKKSS